jgi:hypothetical protein
MSIAFIWAAMASSLSSAVARQPLAMEKERTLVDSNRPVDPRLLRLRFWIVVRMEASWASMSSPANVLL